MTDQDWTPPHGMRRPIPQPMIIEHRGFLADLLNVAGAKVERLSRKVWVVRWEADDDMAR